jgi:gliding motility-associated protein GldM
MAGGKETPRQKMIGMMYLVLTALLAMNVSKDILNGFITVNESLERTNHNFQDNTNRVMDAFKEASKSNAAAVPFLEKATEVVKLTKDLHKYIDLLKKEIVQHTEEKGSYKDSISRDENLKNGWSMWYLDKKDNYDAPTHMLIGDNENAPMSGPNTAKELRQKMTEVHDKLKKMFEEMQKNPKTRLLEEDQKAIIKKISSMLPTDPDHMEDGVKETWETQNFYHLPLAAVVTNLTKMQSDIKNVEAECISQLSGASGKIAIKFDRLAAKVIAPSSYVQSGQKYNADVFLAASSSSMTAEQLSIHRGATYDSVAKKCNGCDATDNTLPISDGMGKYEASAAGVGEQKWGGVIKFKKPNGEFEFYPFESTYMVAAPSAAISADAMNVFYMGVDNPISVSAAGIAPSELQVTNTGGALKNVKPGVFSWNPPGNSPKEVEIKVSAKTKDGTKPQGSKKFRVKRIPDPVASLSGKKTGEYTTKAEMAVAQYIFAKMENFDFDAKFTVLKWEMLVVTGGKGTPVSGTGGSVNADAKAALAKIGAGSRIILEVTAKGPDGTTRSLPPCVLKVK